MSKRVNDHITPIKNLFHIIDTTSVSIPVLIIALLILFAVLFAAPMFAFAGPIPSANIADDSVSEEIRKNPSSDYYQDALENNPYKANYTIRLDIGSEFAEYPGSEYTEGYVYKISESCSIQLPYIKAKPGYIFVGWSQGGVSQPSWDINTRTLDIDIDDSTENNSASIAALFADEYGNGYCTCGDYREGYYTDNIEQYKQDYTEYLKTFQKSDSFLLGIAGLVFILVALFLMFWFIFCYEGKMPRKLKYKQRKCELATNEDNKNDIQCAQDVEHNHGK